MDMTITKKTEGNAVILQLKGWLDTETSPALADLIDEMTEISRLVLDFAEVAYISSAGIRILIRAHKKMYAQQGTLEILHVHADILEILRMSGLDQKLTIL